MWRITGARLATSLTGSGALRLWATATFSPLRAPRGPIAEVNNPGQQVLLYFVRMQCLLSLNISDQHVL